MLLSFVPPPFTTDLERNLFYGEAFWSHGFQVYELTPIEIDSSYNITDPSTGQRAYPLTTYDYPSIQLAFWAIISILPFAAFFGKLVLLIFDFFNFFLIRSIRKTSGYPSEG
ncbi:MAG TPA: hypothetical protein VJ044_16285, partial [Candidatus Hodarchaeales archaeon]|nr:hypothetical protein [Candidatus Hodarchaeales archaeon]